LRDRTAIDLNGANRLVFELNHIMGIEEVVFAKQRVANFFRVAVQDAGGAQRLDFFRVGRHGSGTVNKDTPHIGSIYLIW
jgi:hypothetical protein